MTKKVFDWNKWGSQWQDSGIFGGVYIHCPCGNEIDDEELDIQNTWREGADSITCDKCWRKYTIKMTTTMFVEEKK